MTENDLEKRILCVGMCVLDIIHICEEFPKEDTDKRCTQGYWQRGGNASNNCTVLRQLGAECEFLGVASRSEAFGFLRKDCENRRILVDNCPVVDQDPPFSSVILNRKAGTRTIIHSNSNFPILTYENFKKLSLANYHWVHFEGRNPSETTKMIADIVAHNQTHSQQIRISIELEKVKTENFELTKNADYIFLGKELALFLGWTEPKEAVEKLKTTLGLVRSNIICTWGAAGSTCLSAEGHFASVESFPPSEVVDTLGAGDTFCAATIYALGVRGLEVAEAVRFGNKIAGFKCGTIGYDRIGEYHLK